MANKIYVIENASFLSRLARTIFNGYLAYILILVFIGGIFSSSGFLFTLYVCLGILGYIIIGSFVKNIYFMNSINIDPESRSVTISILKYNKLHFKSTIPINEVQIDLFERKLMYNSFYLLISTTEKRIIKQPSVGGWRKKKFEEIVNEFSRLKTLNESN
jgi:hypothetical protein